MIYGIGTDIVKNDRIKSAVERWGEKFLNRIFTDAEKAYCQNSHNPYPSMSARFAAKEAFIKAFSYDQPLALKDIEVKNENNGRPVLELHGTTAEIVNQRGVGNIYVTLSHEYDYSIAFVVIEGSR